MTRKNLKKYSIFLLAMIFLSSLMYATFSVISIPERITIYENQKLNTSKIYSIKLVNKSGVLSDGKIINDTTNLKQGTYDASLNVMGINVKPVKVNVVKNKSLIPCGNCVGITLSSDGLLVVGIADFTSYEGKKVSPAKSINIRVGDIIKRVDGTPIYSVDKMAEFVEKSDGKKMEFEVLRGNKTHNVSITPELDKLEGVYKLGLWLRDSTAGIGTMTFYDPETKKFASLGHGITDNDTGDLVPSDSGSITEATVFSVKKGKKGEPGELQGVFLVSEGEAGRVEENTAVGVFGTINDETFFKGKTPIPIALSGDVKCGEATILANVDEQKTEEFKIEIEKINSRSKHSSKGMVIRITDQNLINKTGGIVQGMSGSPIIQNGKLVGAVTHVFVNDPTRGYGIFIENMLSEAND